MREGFEKVLCRRGLPQLFNKLSQNISALVAQLVARMLNKPWIVERIRSWVRTPAGVLLFDVFPRSTSQRLFAISIDAPTNLSPCPFFVLSNDQICEYVASWEEALSHDFLWSKVGQVSHDAKHDPGKPCRARLESDSIRSIKKRLDLLTNYAIRQGLISCHSHMQRTKCKKETV